MEKEKEEDELVAKEAKEEAEKVFLFSNSGNLILSVVFFFCAASLSA